MKFNLSSTNKLLHFTKKGIYCPQAQVYIDPWSSVDKAIITHAHSDHARPGSNHYLAHKKSVPILKHRLGKDINVNGIEYNESIEINGVKISLHPAGHIPGSAQVRLEYKGEVAVVSGDYKLEDDGLTEAFEPVKCNTFVTESTFGLPVYKWKKQKEIFDDINNWWRQNKEKGKASVICGYSLGKAQRILFNVDKSIGRIFGHGAVTIINEAMSNEQLNLPLIEKANSTFTKKDFVGSLIIAPPSAIGNPWLRKFEPYSLGYASGWMNIRGAKRREGIDIGFALSDHADWNELNTAVKETGAEKIYVTHGYTAVFVKWLCENGFNAEELKTEFIGESDQE
ncbi:MAG: ligase-associated DNA damage response exonuclease [Ignavibacteria bacterium]|nr:ligase-associated DNA damage response exonuclease [Ignavibacteria bacterium]